MFRRLGLSGKCATSLLLAAAPPFLVLLLVMWLSGRHQLLVQRGLQHQREAAVLVDAIHQAADAEADKLRVWANTTPELTPFAADRSRMLRMAIPAVIVRHSRLLDEIWPSLPPGDPQLAAVLDNPAARAMKDYQAIEPAAARLMLTDSIGRLIATNAKSSNYYQGEESWWRHGARLEPGRFWQDGIRFDEQLRTHTLDLALPLHRQDQLIGVLKMTLRLDHLVSRVMAQHTVQGTRWQMLLRDGQILAGTRGAQLPTAWHERMRAQERGWASSPRPEAGFTDLAGFAPFSREPDQTQAYLVVSLPAHNIPPPISNGLLAATCACLLLCLGASAWLQHRAWLQPIGRIWQLLGSMSELARLRNLFPDDKAKLREQQQQVESQLHDIQQLRSGDQLESVARETATLVSRVLRYQHDLEKEDEQP